MARSRIRTRQPASTSHGENASTTETSQDNYEADQHQPQEASVADSEFEVERLREFLDDHFPGETDWSNRQHPETPVDTAIRLLTGLHATTPPQQVKRCETQFCNKPDQHSGSHGWVHFG